MNIRLIATDIDGTLYSAEKGVSPQTVSAIEACLKAQIPFVPCTGRWYGEALGTLQALGLTNDNIIISSMGSHISTLEGKTLWHCTIPEETAHAAFNIIQKYNFYIKSHTLNTMFVHNVPQLPYRTQARTYVSPCGKQFQTRLVSPAEFECMALKGCMKLEFRSADTQAMQQCRDELRAIGLEPEGYGPCVAEVVCKNMGKGAGTLQLAAMYNIAPSEIMAFGDSANDISMLQAVGWPVAVENASEHVKAFAKLIAPACDESGVAQTIFKYIL